MPATARKTATTVEVPLRAAAEIETPLGGPVGDLHRSLHDRLSTDGAMALPFETLALPLDERIVQGVSRAMGPILLAAGFLGVAALIF